MVETHGSYASVGLTEDCSDNIMCPAAAGTETSVLLGCDKILSSAVVGDWLGMSPETSVLSVRYGANSIKAELCLSC